MAIASNGTNNVAKKKKRRKEGAFERAGKWADRNLVPDWRQVPKWWSTYGLALLGAMPVARENIGLLQDALPGPVYAKVMLILAVATFAARMLRQGEK